MVMMCGNYNAGEPYSCVHVKCMNADDAHNARGCIFFSMEVCSWCVPVHGWSFDVYFPYSAQFFVDNSIVVGGMNSDSPVFQLHGLSIVSKCAKPYTIDIDFA